MKRWSARYYLYNIHRARYYLYARKLWKQMNAYPSPFAYDIWRVEK